jgi:hypothetical protein
MVTLSGNRLNPRSFTLSTLDVAQHLGRIVRFGGSVKGWWTVLQHSLLVARLMHKYLDDPRLEICGLHHDDAEVLTGDVVRPWKSPETAALQAMLDTVIGASLGLPDFTEDDRVVVKEYDDLACKVEAHVMAPIVVTRHPTSFGPLENAEKHFKEGLFDGLWAGDLAADMHSTWNADGALIRMFVAEHERLMKACGMEIRPPRAITLPGVDGALPIDDRTTGFAL